MKRKIQYFFCLSICLLVSIGCDSDKLLNTKKPNIIYILADDLGYGELGVYGQKYIETPNIDKLAKSGMIFNNHYTGAPVCAPARSILLTGKHSGNNYIRGNSEWSERGDVWSFEAMFDDPHLEGQKPLADSIITISQVLQKNGYRTGMVGKWGLGGPTTNSIPNKKGFDFFYGYNCQRQAHTFYPTHLWKNETRHILDNFIVTKQEGIGDNDPNDPFSYNKYNQNDYAPTLMHKEAIDFVSRNKNSPFFLYYASPIPHLPLQAPKNWVSYYEKKFGKESPYTGKSYYPNRTPRATYAAMISYLDEQVGDLVSKLKEIGIYENTLIIFSSDNGPTWVDHVDYDFFNSTGKFTNSRRTMKGSLSEGGIRIPMIVSWPDKIKPGSKSNHISSFYDFFETACDIAGIENTHKTDGISFYNEIIGKDQIKHNYLYWEYPASGGLQAIRMGKWKAIRKNLFEEVSKIELYNLSVDEKELNDISKNHPELIKEFEVKFKESHSTPILKEFIIPNLEL